MAAIKPPKKTKPKKVITSPSISASQVQKMADYFDWLSALPIEVSISIDSPAATLVRRIKTDG